MTRPARTRAPRVLLALALAAGCSDAGPSAPTGKGVRALEIELAAPLLEPLDTVQLSARARFADGSTIVLSPGELVWNLSTSTVAEIGADGRLVTRAAGTVTVTVRYAGVTGKRDVVIPPATLDRVTLALHGIDGMLPGGEWVLRWQGFTRRGRTAPAGQKPSFISRDPRIATVDSLGRVSALAAGRTTVVAAGVGTPDSAVVTVLAAAGNLGLASAAAISIEPGAELVLHGRGLSGASVSIANVPATTTVLGDTLLLVQVPMLPAFQPCMPPGTLPVAITAGGRALTAALPAEAPLRLGASVGQHHFLGERLAGGCRVELEPGGHLLVPFTWDRKSHGNARADTARVRLTLGDGPGASVPLASAAILVPAATRESDWQLPVAAAVDAAFARLDPGARANLSAAAACAPPAAPGDSMLVLTERTPAGRFVFTSGNNPQRLEWWYLAYQNEAVSLVVDSAARRIYSTQAQTGTTVRDIADWFAREASPVLNAMYADALPDLDGNGHIIMQSAANSDAGGGGGTGRYANAGCAGGTALGEAFYVPLDWMIDFQSRPEYMRAYYVSSLMHEAGHTHDLARRSAYYPQGWPATSPASGESMAILATDLWSRRFPTTPLSPANSTPPVRMLYGGEHASPCWRIIPATLPKTLPGYGGAGGWRDSYGYDQGCQAFQFFLGRALAEGGSLPEILTRFTRAPRGTYADMASALLGRTVSGREAVGNWLLSWYADDRVPGAGPAITNAMFDTPASHAAAKASFPLPHRTVTGGGERLELVLGEPDARFILVQLDRALRISVTRASGGSPDYTVFDVAYLRTATR